LFFLRPLCVCLLGHFLIVHSHAEQRERRRELGINEERKEGRKKEFPANPSKKGNRARYERCMDRGFDNWKY
jgi:hypothetical protein